VYEPPLLFEDEQVRGPFRRWHHRHEMAPDVLGARLTDIVDFELPFALVSRWFVVRVPACGDEFVVRGGRGSRFEVRMKR